MSRFSRRFQGIRWPSSVVGDCFNRVVVYKHIVSRVEAFDEDKCGCMNPYLGMYELHRCTGWWLAKLTYEQHLRDITARISQKIGILRKCWRVYQDDSLINKCFFAFILPYFEYCSSVWMSAAPTHINMLQRVFMSARFIAGTQLSLDHRRQVASLCIFFKIYNNPAHPMHSRLPPPANNARRTRRERRMNSCALASVLSPNTLQFNRSFLPTVIELWNTLPQSSVDALSMNIFKRSVNRHLLEWTPEIFF